MTSTSKVQFIKDSRSYFLVHPPTLTLSHFRYYIIDTTMSDSQDSDSGETQERETLQGRVCSSQ